MYNAIYLLLNYTFVIKESTIFLIVRIVFEKIHYTYSLLNEFGSQNFLIKMIEPIFIDLQGFRSNSNQFIVKEVAIVYSDNEVFSFIVKPPYKFECLTAEKQKQARWLTKRFHGLHWSDGTVPYSTVKQILWENVKDLDVCVQGMEKKKWLEHILEREVFNIQEITSTNLKILEKQYPNCYRCNDHGYGSCAVKNAFLIRKDYQHYKDCQLYNLNNI